MNDTPITCDMCKQRVYVATYAVIEVKSNFAHIRGGRKRTLCPYCELKVLDYIDRESERVTISKGD